MASLALLFLAVSPMASAQPEFQVVLQTADLTLYRCGVPGVEDFYGFCGVFEVYENREAKRGRRLSLPIRVLSSREELRRDKPPVVYLPGGPGQSGIRAAPTLAQAFSTTLQERDVVLVDVRGTGSATNLVCEDTEFLRLPEPARQATLSTLGPACQAALARKADLTQYTSANIVDDVEDLRTALGYGQVHLYGASFGTRLALVYVHRHPEAVATMVLQGPIPTNVSFFGGLAKNVDASLDSVMRACARAPQCDARFPDLENTLAQARARLAEDPPFFEWPVHDAPGDSGAEKRENVTVRPDALENLILMWLYEPTKIARIPALIDGVANGDEAFLEEVAAEELLRQKRRQSGLYLANLCSEDLPLVSLEQYGSEHAGHLLGQRALATAVRMCGHHPERRSPLPPRVTSDVPALIIVGEHDPVTPPRWARQIHADLPRSHVLEIPGDSHERGVLGSACIDRLIAELIGTQRLDPDDLAACRNVVVPLPFVADDLLLASPVTVPHAEIARWAGLYDSRRPYGSRISDRRHPKYWDWAEPTGDRVLMLSLVDGVIFGMSPHHLFWMIDQPFRLHPIGPRTLVVDRTTVLLQMEGDDEVPTALTIVDGTEWVRLNRWSSPSKTSDLP